MELWLLGAGVIVLIAITLLLVWPAPSAEPRGVPVRDEEDTRMLPQGDEFEDQYTSATADLSAGGVATALTLVEVPEVAAPVPTPYGAAGEAWSSPTIAHEGMAATPGSATSTSPRGAAPPWPPPTPARVPRSPSPVARQRTIGLAAAALVIVGGAVCGAWLYARWQRRRDAPINRLRRSLREARELLR